MKELMIFEKKKSKMHNPIDSSQTKRNCRSSIEIQSRKFHCFFHVMCKVSLIFSWNCNET